MQNLAKRQEGLQITLTAKPLHVKVNNNNNNNNKYSQQGRESQTHTLLMVSSIKWLGS